MNIPPKYEDVMAQLEAERELHKIATETLGQFADENQKLHADLAALREELAKQVERANDFASKLTGEQQRLTVAEQRVGDLELSAMWVRSQLTDAVVIHHIDVMLKPGAEGEGS